MIVVLVLLDRRGDGVGGMLACSPSEFGTLTPYEGSICVLYIGGSSVIGIIWCLIGIIPGVFACVTCWCVHGADCIWSGSVGVVNVW